MTTAVRAKSSGRGSKPGERRGGRQKGTPNKATVEIKELFRAHAQDALDAAVRILKESESDDTRLRAATFIIERGYGKAVQPVDGDGEGGAIKYTKIVLCGPE